MEEHKDGVEKGVDVKVGGGNTEAKPLESLKAHDALHVSFGGCEKQDHSLRLELRDGRGLTLERKLKQTWEMHRGLVYTALSGLKRLRRRGTRGGSHPVSAGGEVNAPRMMY